MAHSLLEKQFQQWFDAGTSPSIIISTDLEPDDVVAICLLLNALTSRKGHRRLTFLVGEGHAGQKVIRLQKMLDFFKAKGLITDDIKTEIIAGFGSDKEFALGGNEFFLEREAMQAMMEEQGLSSGSTEAEHQTSLRQLTDLLEQHPSSLIIGLKPPREFLALEDKSLLSKASLIEYSSFNLRTLILGAMEVAKARGEDDDLAGVEVESDIDAFHWALKSVYFFESRPVVGPANNVNQKQLPALFELIESHFPFITRLMSNWKTHLLGADPEKVADMALNADNKAEIIRVLGKDWSQYAETRALTLVDFDQQEKKVKDKIGLKLKKWKSLTSAGQQLILADPATVMAMLDLPVDFAPADIRFNASYFSEYFTNPRSNIHVCVPKPTEGPSPSADDMRIFNALLTEKNNLERSLRLPENSDNAAMQLALSKVKENIAGYSPNIQALQKACYDATLAGLLRNFRVLHVETTYNDPLKRQMVMEKEFERIVDAKDEQALRQFYADYPLKLDGWYRFSNYQHLAPDFLTEDSFAGDKGNGPHSGYDYPERARVFNTFSFNYGQKLTPAMAALVKQHHPSYQETERAGPAMRK